MSKEKLKLYKGKRVVIGDKNLVTKHEIHVEDVCDNDTPISTSNLEYIDARELDSDVKRTLVFTSQIVRSSLGDNKLLMPSALAYYTVSVSNQLTELVENLLAVAIDPNGDVISDGAELTVSEFVKLAFSVDLTTLPRITEEEFYNL